MSCKISCRLRHFLRRLLNVSRWLINIPGESLQSVGVFGCLSTWPDCTRRLKSAATNEKETQKMLQNPRAQPVRGYMRPVALTSEGAPPAVGAHLWGLAWCVWAPRGDARGAAWRPASLIADSNVCIEQLPRFVDKQRKETRLANYSSIGSASHVVGPIG